MSNVPPPIRNQPSPSPLVRYVWLITALVGLGIIAGVIFVCGLGFSNGLSFTIGGTTVTLTALAIAAIAGILLNMILPGNDYEFGVNKSGDENRGIHA